MIMVMVIITTNILGAYYVSSIMKAFQKHDLI